MIKFVHLLIIPILLVSCESGTVLKDFLPSTQQPKTGSLEEEGNKLEVYFSDPWRQIAGDYGNGPDRYLVQAIADAKVSVDLAIYSINLWSIRDALLDAHRQGLQIRIIIESDRMSDEIPQELKSGGLNIIGDRREGLMHNKFIILDRQDVWTGSMNFTLGSMFYDNNNVVHIHSSEVAEDFITEFDEMFLQDMFGKDSISDTPHPQVLVGDTLLEVYFSPDDGVEEHILEFIDNAGESIYFMAYSFTSDQIRQSIIESSLKGISVKGVMDEGQAVSNDGGEYDSLIQAGIDVRKDGISGLMHNKVIIIDRSIVITGSYNFSKSAEISNDENVIVIHNPEISELFLEEFEKIFAVAKN